MILYGKGPIEFVYFFQSYFPHRAVYGLKDRRETLVIYSVNNKERPETKEGGTKTLPRVLSYSSATKQIIR